jgi:hypothetical protein
MRRITNRQEEEKKKRKNQIILGIILVGVMLLSVLGYGFQREENSTGNNQNNLVKYNGFEFTNNGIGYWTLNLGNFQFIFKNNPNNVTSISSKVNLLDQYSGKPLYIQASNQEASYEISRNLNPVALRIQNACLDKTNITEIRDIQLDPCDESLPIKTCSDNFVIIQERNISDIKQVGNCVFIMAHKEDILKNSDEFLFKVLGVKNG